MARPLPRSIHPEHANGLDLYSRNAEDRWGRRQRHDERHGVSALTPITLCKKAVKARREHVKKASTMAERHSARSSFVLVLAAEGPGGAASRARERPAWIPVNGDSMSVLVYIALTVAIFGLLGLVQKLVEGL